MTVVLILVQILCCENSKIWLGCRTELDTEYWQCKINIAEYVIHNMAQYSSSKCELSNTQLMGIILNLVNSFSCKITVYKNTWPGCITCLPVKPHLAPSSLCFFKLSKSVNFHKRIYTSRLQHVWSDDVTLLWLKI